jgi:ribosomal protein S27AE
MPEKKYKRFKICKGCGQRFLVKHKLRQYCDKCRPG